MMLLIDDTRTFGVDIIARNYEAGVKILNLLPITELYIDFDLGEQMTGLDVLKDTIVMRFPDKITIVSSNPPGRKQIEGFLKDHGYEETEGSWFHIRKESGGNHISRY